jgi:hypothetical protein
MLEALVVATGSGFVLGLRYRVPIVVVASAAAALLGPAVAYASGASFWTVAVAPAAAPVALQCGYLGGLLLSFMVARLKPERVMDAPASCLATKDWRGRSV